MKKNYCGLLAMLLLGAGACWAADSTPTFADHETQILKFVTAGQYGDAIRESAAYELALQQGYPKPVFEGGKLTSAEQGLTLEAAFADGWKTDSDLPDASELAGSGVEDLLAVKADKTGEQLRIVTIDMAAMMRRLGLKEPIGEQAVIDTSKGISESWGHIEIESKTRVGDMNVVRTQIDGGDKSVEAAAFEHGGQFFYVVLAGAKGTARATLSDKMDQLLKSVKFSAADEEMLAKVTAIEKLGTDLDVMVQKVGKLAALDQYREATLQLLDARVAIANKLPKPILTDEKVTFDSYGLTVANPDVKSWKCDAIPVGAMQMLLLRDRQNPETGFIGVMVMDPVLSFGSLLAKDLSPEATDETRRHLLSRIGQGALMNVGRPIENENFRQFHNHLAYEGIVTANGTTNKMKLIAIVGPRAIYMVMIMGAPAKIEGYSKTAEAAVVIEDAAASTQAGK